MARKKRGTTSAVRATAAPKPRKGTVRRPRVTARPKPKKKRLEPKVRLASAKATTSSKTRASKRGVTTKATQKKVARSVAIAVTRAAAKKPRTRAAVRATNAAAKTQTRGVRPTRKTPAPKKPTRKTPAPKKPARKTPAPKKPARKTPAPKKPARKTPAPKKPARKTPAPKKPARKASSKKPVRKAPASKTPKRPKIRRPPRLATPSKGKKQHGWRGRTAEAIPKRRPAKVVHTVHAPGEVLLSKLLVYRDKIASTGQTAPPEGHDFNERWASYSPRAGGRAGVHQNVFIGQVLRADTVEPIAQLLERAMRQVYAALPGFVNASLFFLEYGRNIIGSPGELYFDDGEAFFASTFGGVPRCTPSEFSRLIRQVLFTHVSTDRSAVFLEHATVRAYKERVGPGGPRRRVRRR